MTDLVKDGDEHSRSTVSNTGQDNAWIVKSSFVGLWPAPG